MLRHVTFLCCMGVAQAAQADVTVQFIEGAPKDRFVISTDTGVCADTLIRVTIDMSGSAGGLIFDVTGAGAGVEVFQPLELVAGTDVVTGTSQVTDGDDELVLELGAMPAGAEVAFTIDVDDTVGTRAITVSGSEIIGAELRVLVDGATTSGAFDASGRATAVTPACLS